MKATTLLLIAGWLAAVILSCLAQAWLPPMPQLPAITITVTALSIQLLASFWIIGRLGKQLSQLCSSKLQQQEQIVQMQAEISAQNQRLDLILNSAGTGIYVLDKNKTITFANIAASEITGWQSAESIGKQPHCLIQKNHCPASAADKRCADCGSPNDAEIALPCELYATFADNHKHVRHETFYSKTGAAIPVRFVSAPILENGQLSGVVIIFEDISLRVLAEQQLKDSEALKQAVLESSLDAIVTINAAGLIYEFNRNAEMMFGYTKAEVYLKSIVDLIIPQQYRSVNLAEIAQQLQAGVDNNLRKRIEISALRASGEEFPVELVIAPITINNQIGFTSFISDITERKLARLAIENARIEAEKANTAKSQFLAAMSHEIRTPLNAMMGVTQLLMTTELDSEQALYLKTAQQAGLVLQEVVYNILDFSKIEAGKMDIDLQVAPLLDIVDSVLAIIGAKASEKGLELYTVIDYPIPENVLIDAARIKQILLNLVSNAIKFTDVGHVEIKLSASLSPDADCLLQFSVTDTGIGVAEQIKPLIFEEFSQADLTSTRKYGGTGLGLAIASRLVAAFGGEIHVDSVEGQGSTFWFTINVGKEPLVSPKPATAVHCFLVNPKLKSMRALYHYLQHVSGQVQYVSHIDEIPKDPQLKIVFIDERQLPFFSFTDMQLFKASNQFNCVNVLLSDITHKQTNQAWLKNFDEQLSKPILISQINELIKTAIANYDDGCKQQIAANTPANNTDAIRYKVLLVEDSLANQLIIKSMLEKAQHQVEIAGNGVIAIEKSQQNPYDIILMDLSMPIMGGLEATENIRKQPGPNQSTPIIALTASAFEDKRKACLEIGMNNFLTKPVNMANLLEHIAQLLQNPIASENAFIDEADTLIENSEQPLVDYQVLAQLQKETSETVFPQLMAVFLQQAEQRLELIENAINAQDFSALASEIHTFKSESATFGATKLGEMSEQINFCCNHDNQEQAFMLAKKLKTYWLPTFKALSDYTNQS